MVGQVEQGALEDEDSESIIWMYYRGNEFNLDEEEMIQLELYLKNAKTEITIELSSDEYSNLLAKKFCQKMANKFGNLILYSNEGEFFTEAEIDKVLYDELT